MTLRNFLQRPDVISPMIENEFINVLKVFAPSTIAFFLGIAITPVVTHYLYKYKFWKKKAGKVDPNGKKTPIFNRLHQAREVNTPRLGGVVIWLSVIGTVAVFWFLASLWPTMLTGKLNFLSRDQTWLPLFTLIIASFIGLADDFLEVSGRGGYVAGGMSFKKRLLLVTLLGSVGAWWFYFKLGLSTIEVPFLGEFAIGYLVMPLFVLVMVILFSSSVIDGIDGLAGGVMAIIFSAYAGIAFFQNQIDLATLSGVITGGILAFLWFNIPPARFYMSETGILGLTTTLTVLAFLTKSVLALPIIAFPLFATVIGNVIQLGSKRFRHGKKVFLVAPIHHHFEAMGWPPAKVVMRYWIIGVIFAIIGMVIALIGI